jgi:hypothetical protein
MEDTFIGAARHQPRDRTMEDSFIRASIHINPEVRPWRRLFRRSQTYQPKGRTMEDTFIGAAIHINPEVIGPRRIHL